MKPESFNQFEKARTKVIEPWTTWKVGEIFSFRL